MNEWTKQDYIKAYGEITRALAGIDQVRDCVHIARLGCGLGIPADADIYIAKIHRWLMEEKAMLEQEIAK